MSAAVLGGGSKQHDSLRITAAVSWGIMKIYVIFGASQIKTLI